MDEDGYFFFQARTDDMIISAGYNIAGPEVEGALLAHPAVAECGVVGAPDAERGTVVKAFVVLKPGNPARRNGKSAAGARQEAIAPYKYPRAIEFVDTLPRTETGKLQRFKLRRTHEPADPSAARLGATQRLRERHRRAGKAGVHRGPDRLDRKGEWKERSFAGQFRQALQNILEVLAQAEGRPEHIVRLTWYVLDKQEYLSSLKEVAAAYRSLMGKHYPTMAVVQVSGLVEDEARLEIEAMAVIP